MVPMGTGSRLCDSRQGCLPGEGGHQVRIGRGGTGEGPATAAPPGRGLLGEGASLSFILQAVGGCIAQAMLCPSNDGTGHLVQPLPNPLNH